MSDTSLSPYLRLIGSIGNTRHPGGLKMSDMMLQKIDLKRQDRLLDIGCGAGHTSAHIAKEYGSFVVGVDKNEDALMKARALYSAESYFERLSFIKADVFHLPFSDNYFDVVLCESVLIFVNDKERAFKEMSRVLKPKGFLIINELIMLEKESTTIKNYLARPEMGAYLNTAQTLIDLFKSDQWSILLEDEQRFSLKDQIKSDIAQFGNKKGILQLLELSYLAITKKEIRRDLLSMAKFLLEMPSGLLKNLGMLMILSQKK